MPIIERSKTGLEGDWARTKRYKKDGKVYCGKGHLLTGTDFWVLRESPSQKTWTCRRCETDKKRRKAGRRLAHEAGVTPGRACEICGAEGVQLCADHDHQLDVFRGWLCHSCNAGLGMFQDSIENLLRAVDYLRGL